MDEANSYQLKQEYELEVSSCKSNKEYTELFLYCDVECNFEEFLQSAEVVPTKDESAHTKEHASNMNFEECKSEALTARSHMIVPFDVSNPDMDAFLNMVKEEINYRGVNEVICEALEIRNEDENFLETPQIIRVKKRKSKEQIFALEEEFAKGEEWTKDFMNSVAVKLGLDPAQVYKWHWDQI